MTPGLKYLIWLLPLTLSAPAFSGACDAAIGDWKWFNGGVISIQQNQTLAVGGKPVGKWECTNAQRSLLTLRWNSAYVDTMTVSGDRISGKNQQGAAVSGTRINKAKVGK
ncbi:MAG: hypothetical protein M3Y27_14285 [Acidobacteriota bacterium]|nr:hypothetical protein [Acidobacteriota bacterium]